MNNTYITKWGKVKGFKKDGRNKFAILENGEKVSMTEFKKEKCKIKCEECHSFSELSAHSVLIKRDCYICQSCCKTGDRNPFYGKKHDEKFKESLSAKRKEDYKGEGNPFYGKTHSEATKNKLREINEGKHDGANNSFYGRKHSKESRKRMSRSQKKYYKENEVVVSKRLRENGIKSVLKQSRGRKSNPERVVEAELKRLGIKHKYNKILDNRYQYDFLIDENILLEVHGDYWHGNPKIYKSPNDLNERQVFKKKRDKEKKVFAEKLGYKVIYIWEMDVLNGNFKVIENLCSKKSN